MTTPYTTSIHLSSASSYNKNANTSKTQNRERLPSVLR